VDGILPHPLPSREEAALAVLRALWDGRRTPEALEAAGVALRALGELCDGPFLRGEGEDLEGFRRVQEVGAAWLTSDEIPDPETLESLEVCLGVGDERPAPDISAVVLRYRQSPAFRAKTHRRGKVFGEGCR
jgi:hypothetical protein